MTPPNATEKDADLRRLVGYGIKRANSSMMGAVEQILGRFGFRRTTFSALSVIAANPGLRQAELADLLAIGRPNLVQILDELQRPGLIERVRDPEDRRAYMLRATPDGDTRVAQASAALMAYDQRLTWGLSAPERATLIAALRRVEENAAEAWEDKDAEHLSTS
ncbi:MAG: MarR family transcriptional regulator [Roseicyclus sp.]|nr:MarR family transcriptional regulator [Roseicyclus sp.]